MAYYGKSNDGGCCGCLVLIVGALVFLGLATWVVTTVAKMAS